MSFLAGIAGTAKPSADKQFSPKPISEIRASPRSRSWAAASRQVRSSVECSSTSTAGSGSRPAATPTDRSPLGGIWRPGRPAAPQGRPRERRSAGLHDSNKVAGLNSEPRWVHWK